MCYSCDMEYVKPNIKVPVELWGEVKVAAWRRGMRVGELVVECLSKAFVEGKVIGGERVKVAPRPISEPKKATVEEAQECKHEWVVRNGKTECMYCRRKP